MEQFLTMFVYLLILFFALKIITIIGYKLIVIPTAKVGHFLLLSSSNMIKGFSYRKADTPTKIVLQNFCLSVFILLLVTAAFSIPKSPTLPLSFSLMLMFFLLAAILIGHFSGESFDENAKKDWLHSASQSNESETLIELLKKFIRL